MEKVSVHEAALIAYFSSLYLLQVETGDVGDVYKIRISCDDLPGFEGWHLKSFHMQELHTKQEVNFDCNCWLSVNREDRELVKEFPAVNENQKPLPGKNSKGDRNKVNQTLKKNKFSKYDI